MRKCFLIFYINCSISIAYAQKERIYFIHGQGSDERLFKNIHLDTSRFESCFILIPLPQKKETMLQIAIRAARQIDTSSAYSIIGVSLGGMITSELVEFLHPRKAVIISSAGYRAELPKRYRRMVYFPIYKIIPSFFFKIGSFIAQPLFEPDRRKEKTTCNAMLCRKNPLFLKRATGLIIHWDKKVKHPSLIHIHGNNDHTLPIKTIQYNYLINKGSHMMTLTLGEEISNILNEILK